MGLWQVRWQRRLVELGNKLNNQAFQTLRGLPKLRVAAAENYAYAAWAREFARTRELQQRVGPHQEPHHGPRRGLSAAVLAADVHAAGGPGPRQHVGGRVPHLQHLGDHAADLRHPAHRRARLGGGRRCRMFEEIKPVLDEAPEVRGASAQPGALSGAIEARKLSFRYSDDGPLVLDDVPPRRTGRVRGDRRPQRLRLKPLTMV